MEPLRPTVLLNAIEQIQRSVGPPRKEVKTPISVAVVSPDLLMTELLYTALRNHPAIRMIPGHRSADADVLLMLVDDLDEDDMDTMGRFASQNARPPRPIVLICRRVSEHHVVSAIDHGLMAVINRDEADVNHVVGAILNTQLDRAEMPLDALGLVLRRMRMMRSSSSLVSQVNSRERDVVRLLAEGLSTSEMAFRMNFSERTIKNIVESLTTRFELKNRTHLVAFGFRNGFF